MRISNLILALIFPAVLFGNAAQPGLWNAGGAGSFSLLFPEDSLTFKKIQMINEKVSIQLYKGFAVVKGEYWMYNSAGENYQLKVGYPLNSYLMSGRSSHYAAEIYFDFLYALKVFSGGTPVEIISVPMQNDELGSDNDNWYVWVNEFPADDTTKITVYFIVNTNSAVVSEGYSKDEVNGFVYLLETGATWKQPIVKGEVRIELMEELNADDIRGVYPYSIFRVDPYEKILLYNFENLSPTPENNIIISYSQSDDNFSFENILKNETSLFNSIDRFSDEELNASEFEKSIFNDPFETSSFWGKLFGWFFFILSDGSSVAPYLIFALLILIIFLRRRRK